MNTSKKISMLVLTHTWFQTNAYSLVAVMEAIEAMKIDLVDGLGQISKRFRFTNTNHVQEGIARES